MKIVIDIPDKAYKEVKRDIPENLNHTPYKLLAKSIRNGTPFPKGEWLRLSLLSENEDDRYKCSHCGNIVHHSSKMNLYTFNSFCGRCGSNNER